MQAEQMKRLQEHKRHLEDMNAELKTLHVADMMQTVRLSRSQRSDLSSGQCMHASRGANHTQLQLRVEPARAVPVSTSAGCMHVGSDQFWSLHMANTSSDRLACRE